MPIYEIEQFELHITTYRVEADDPADAIVKVLDGEAESVDGSHEYVEIAEERGVLVTDHPELAAKLRELGVPVGDQIIPSIRSVSKVEQETAPVWEV